MVLWVSKITSAFLYVGGIILIFFFLTVLINANGKKITFYLGLGK